MHDSELEELFEDRSLLGTALLLREAPRPSPDPSPLFRAALRRRLMEEAARRRQAQRPWWRRLAEELAPPPLPAPQVALAGLSALLSPPRMAAAGAGIGVALVALVLMMVNGVPLPGGGTATPQYQSPLDHAQAVALVTPIQLTFNQPMDRQTVERSVRITPTTRATYQWRGDNTLEIRPVSGLAPNTLYQVAVGPGAKTASGKRLSASPVISFKTWSGSGSSSPTTLGDVRQLVSGAQHSVWSSDGQTLYVIGPGGQLLAVPASGGPARVLESAGVTLVVAGPDGPAYVRDGDVHYDHVLLRNVNPVTIGFQDGRLVVVSGQSVLDADGDEVAELDDQPKEADFASSGDRLAYLGSSGLHVVDLRSGKDRLVGPVDRLGAWSTDGHRFAYFHDGKLYVTDGSRTSRLADAPGATDVSWSPRGMLLVGGPSNLQVLRGDGAQVESVSGSFGQAQWAPGGSTFSFKRSGHLYVGTAPTAPSPSPSTAPGAQPSAAPSLPSSTAPIQNQQPTPGQQTPTAGPSPSSPTGIGSGPSPSASPTPRGRVSPSPTACPVRGQRASSREVPCDQGPAEPSPSPSTAPTTTSGSAAPSPTVRTGPSRF